VPRPVERLRDATVPVTGEAIAVRGARVYYRDNRTGLSLYSQPVEGGTITPVFPAEDLPLQVQDTVLLEDGMIFRCVDAPAAKRPAGFVPSPLDFIGASSASTQTAYEGLRYFHVAFDGSSPQDILKDRRSR